MKGDTPAAGTGLDRILAAGWADPSGFSPEEFARAEAFWRERRRDDRRLLAIHAKAADLVQGWTGQLPRGLGSVIIQTNLGTSDIDLGLGYPAADRDRLASALARHARFDGEQPTPFGSTRLAYAFTCDGVEVDVSLLVAADLRTACRMLEQIGRDMSREERIACTWVKHLLHTAGRTEDYAAWKLATYARFCPEFIWVPMTGAARTAP